MKRPASALVAWRRAWDQLTLYLPMLVLCALAMGSWWLVRSMPDLGPEPPARAQRKEPDYHLEDFSTQVFDAQGQSVRQLSGARARHYPDSDELHIDNVRFATRDAQGAQVLATAQLGIASGDGERVTLRGQVHVRKGVPGQTAELEMRTQELVALQKQERLLSSRPVEILRSGNRFWADGMDFNTRSGHYQLQGRVRGVLQPREP